MSEPCSCGRGYIRDGITYCYRCGGNRSLISNEEADFYNSFLPASKVPEPPAPLPAAYDFVSWVDDVCRAFSYLSRDLRACTARLARSWGILAPLPPGVNAPLRHVVSDDTCDMP